MRIEDSKKDIVKSVSVSQPRIGNVRLVAIDGHGGSGKSTLAAILAKKLEAEIIHTDDFAGWENPRDWWPLIIERVFEPIEKGATTLNYPRSKWSQTHHPKPVVDQPVTKIMILEGVSALRKEFRPYISLGIFVDTPKEMCLKRGFERDKGQDGKSDEQIKQMWCEWSEEEDKYIASDEPIGFANIVLDGTKPFDDQLLI